jgi:hypothetical protein
VIYPVFIEISGGDIPGSSLKYSGGDVLSYFITQFFFEISGGDIPSSSLKYLGVIYPVLYLNIRGGYTRFFIKISGGDIPGYSLKSA